MENIGGRLDFYKKNKGLTYKVIASELKLTEGAVRNAIKRDTLKLSHINVICDKFDMSKEWLLSGIGDMYSNKESASKNEKSKPSDKYHNDSWRK